MQIYKGAAEARQDGLSSIREHKLCLHRNLLRNLGKEDILHMMTISLQSIYYALGIAGILCKAAYKLDYEIGKNTRK